jgi:hypothetical protein
VLALVLPDRHAIGLVQQDVGCLEHRVGEQAGAHDVALPSGHLVLELGHALELTEGGEAAQDPGQLGVLGDV